jgi:hypothetical protein
MIDFEKTMSDHKRAWQGRGAYSRIPNTYPTPKPLPDKDKPSIAAKGERYRTGSGRNPDRGIYRPVFPRYAARNAKTPDVEMGFLPIIAAAIPAVTSLVGSLFGKKSAKTGAPPPEANTAKQVLDMLTQAGVSGSASGSVDLKDVIKNIVATIPSPVIGQVKAAIAEMKNQASSEEQARDLITANIDAKFQPQLTALLATIKTQALQKQATHEHETIKAKEAFRKNTTDSLATGLSSLDNISRRLSAIEARLQTSAIASGPRRIALLGGKSVIEG